MYTHDYNMSQKLSCLHVNVGTYETPKMVCQSKKKKKRKDQCIATAMSLQDMYIKRRLAHVESNY